MTSLDSINLITFVFLLNFLSQEVLFIMSKCCFDHFFLTQFIFVKNVQMSFSYDCCARQKKFCVIFNKFNKCSKCVCLKKSCSLFFSFLIMNSTQLLKTYEKIENERTVLSDEKQCLFDAFQVAEIKKC